MSLYFVSTGDGVEYYHTEQDAIKSAQEWIDEYRTLPEWDEAVDRVCWGEVRQQTREVTVGDNDEFVDFILVDVEPNPAATSDTVPVRASE